MANGAVIVPLVARGRVHGVLAAGFDRLPASQDEALLALFEDLARRAALALDSARLYAERDHVARTLQRSLLPAELPEIPGVEVAARYVAAGDGNEVGGDFYDCFATGAGDWALVIGDVCGKGAEAAALTALARYTLRAAALAHAAPAVPCSPSSTRHCCATGSTTASARCCTRRSPRARTACRSACPRAGTRCRSCCVRAAAVETVGSPGTLLGIVDAPQLGEQSVELAPGDALLLYTDGVTEADRDAAPGRLAAFLAGCAGADAGRDRRSRGARRARGPGRARRATTSRSLRCAPTAARWCRLSPRAMG